MLHDVGEFLSSHLAGGADQRSLVVPLRRSHRECPWRSRWWLPLRQRDHHYRWPWTARLRPADRKAGRLAHGEGRRSRGLPDRCPQPGPCHRAQPAGLRSHPAPDDVRKREPQARSPRPPALSPDPAPRARQARRLPHRPPCRCERAVRHGDERVDETPEQPPGAPSVPGAPPAPGAPAAPTVPPAVVRPDVPGKIVQIPPVNRAKAKVKVVARRVPHRRAPAPIVTG